MTAPTAEPLTLEYLADPADPVFEGHYPGYPILPGVYILDLVDRTARVALEPHGRVVLDRYERCRFTRPVYPGDLVTVSLTVGSADDHVPCRASVRTAAGGVAEIRLRYRREADR